MRMDGNKQGINTVYGETPLLNKENNNLEIITLHFLLYICRFHEEKMYCAP